MRRVYYSVAMSLDAYIAGPNGEHDWIVIDPEIDFREIYNLFDTVLMGRRTFEVAGGKGGSMPGMRTFVASRTLRQEDYPKVTVLGENLAEEVAKLRAQPGKDIWLFGGGSLFRSLLEARQVDAVGVAVVPVVLGGGVPLLPPPAPRATLKLVSQKVYKATGTVSLEYAVEYAAARRARPAKRKRAGSR
jgi:dihydrofolate reductase